MTASTLRRRATISASATVAAEITAAGGAWNVSIACEYISYKGNTQMAHGLGAVISDAMDKGNYSVLAASVMANSGGRPRVPMSSTRRSR